MRMREMRIVVAFHTTADAMATERTCRQHDVAGRLISVPRQITSDCGIAWSGPVETHRQLEELLTSAGIDAAGFYELLL